jgi:hypothetical protein
MDLTDEAIAAFAEHLIPEAFTTASSASRVDIVADQPSGGQMPRWIQRCQSDAVAAGQHGQGGPGGVVFVQRRDERWRWDLPHAIWPLEALVDRVRDEVAGFPSPRVFVCSLWDLQRHRLREGPDVDLASLTWTLPWYFEVRAPGRAAVLTGATAVHGSTIGATRALPDRTGFERAARRVLLRHPSRRQYRLG